MFNTLSKQIGEIGAIDVHTHISSSHMAAMGLHDILLYHMVVNRQIGFFSDAYCVEWLYTKSKLVRMELAKALADRIARGQYTLDGAVETAKKLFA